MTGCRIGADIGGTFTDLVLAAADGRRLAVAKLLTTPEPDDAVIAGIRQLLEAAQVPAVAVAQVLHGTTLFANAIIERRGPRTGLIATRGFRDAVEIAREHRYDLYDLHLPRSIPLAPRHLRFEVTERTLADGSVRTPLVDAEMDRVAAEVEAAGVEALAVALLHSYRNPEPERRLGAYLATRLPGVAITLSSRVAPEIREYDRTTTALANAFVQPLAARYLRRLQARLRDLGLDVALLLMQSNGGLCEAETAAKFPIRLLESGPAAGALAAALLGCRHGSRDLLSFDMGGTTAKACIIAGGEPLLASEFELDRRQGFKKGSGMPIKAPSIEMIEIGTGGGSIAHVDALRRLRVGPRSAGAAPGPACYGRGGRQPTVTDADLVLGYLDPGFFLGGELRLDVAAAEHAIHEHVALPLGLDLLDAAWGIHRLANESMAAAARIHALERGHDASQLPIFAFGGAGPVHAHGVATILRSPRAIYPMAAGVFSSLGFLAAPPSFDFVRSLPAPLSAVDWDEVNRLFAEMEDEGRAILGRVPGVGAVGLHRYADMRYVMQGYELRVAIAAGARAEELHAGFEREYSRHFGRSVPGAAVEVVSWRVQARGAAPPQPIADAATGHVAGDARKGERRAWVPQAGGLLSVPVYDRYRLAAGETIATPAIFEERESTVVIAAAGVCRVLESGTLSAEARA